VSGSGGRAEHGARRTEAAPPPRAPRPEPRALGVEALDSRTCDAGIVRATLRDVQLANKLFGGRAAVAFGVDRLLERARASGPITLLDVGAGLGDVAAFLARRPWRAGATIHPVAVDWHAEAARQCCVRRIPATVADAATLPFHDRAFDVVVASQLLHHFPHDAAARLARELDRVARIGVVIADLERRRAAALGIWAASFPLGFHPVSRHDGVLSVRRGFRAWELAAVLDHAGMDAQVYRRPGYRVVGIWQARGADAR